MSDGKLQSNKAVIKQQYMKLLFDLLIFFTVHADWFESGLFLDTLYYEFLSHVHFLRSFWPQVAGWYV